jgi:hypothetical protein
MIIGITLECRAGTAATVVDMVELPEFEKRTGRMSS